MSKNIAQLPVHHQKKRQALRQEMRQKRQNSALLTALAEETFIQKVCEFITQQKAKTVALYFSFDGEVPTEKLIQTLWQKDIKVCLPILHPKEKGQLLFLSYEKNTPMEKNKFGILEPCFKQENLVPLENIDIIFTPLVAFDKQHYRLGLGGGFYDRTLENWQQKNFLPVGLAYTWQEVENLPLAPWDVPLFQIITD